MWTRRLGSLAVLLFLADGAAALAADPPGRVGRLSLVEGTVSLRTAAPATQESAQHDSAEEDWAPASLNYPVTNGNALWTEFGARAELQVGAAELRLNERTELEVVRLDDRATQLALRQGTVNLHLGARQPGGLQLATPRGAVSIEHPGSYRIDVGLGSDEAEDVVQVTVFDGEARIAVGTEEKSNIHTVRRGQSTKLAGEPVDIILSDARITAFDEWARSRDPRAAQQPQTLAHISPQVTGYQDLDDYGTWAPAPDYGTVWYPTRVVDDWAPYRDGNWAYVAPWGWTWIDDAPWGFAPFHYGRWVQIGHRWAWWPGRRATRPIYAPALVAFVGGDGWSIGLGLGNARPVGWVPLAPYELYRPHYRTSATYIRNVNITTVNTTVINNITVNKNKDVEIAKFANRSAATVVSSDSFARGRKVNEARLTVPRKQIEGERVTADIRKIVPAAAASRMEQPRPTARTADARRASGTERAARDATPRMPSLPRQSVQMESAKDSAATGSATAPAVVAPQAATAATRENRRDDRRDERRDRAAPASQAPQAEAVQELAKETAKEAAKEPPAANTTPAPVPPSPSPAPAATREDRHNEGRDRMAVPPSASATQEQRVPRPDRRVQRRAEHSPFTSEQPTPPQQTATPQPAAAPESRTPRPDRREQRRDEPPQQSAPAPPQSAPQQAAPTPQSAAVPETRAPRPERQLVQQQGPEQEQRRQAQEQQRQQRAQTEQQRQAQEQQQRGQAEQQQRQTQEQQQRQAQEQQRAQAEQQQRQQAEAQQRAQTEQQQRQAQLQQRAQVEQQQRAQAEAQQRQAQEQQQQQRQAQEQQRQQQREQSRDEPRRKGPDGKRDRAG